MIFSIFFSSYIVSENIKTPKCCRVFWRGIVNHRPHRFMSLFACSNGQNELLYLFLPEDPVVFAGFLRIL